MKYDFDRFVDRHNTASAKWDGIQNVFGVNEDDIIPMWVADMDFLSPPEVIKAIEKRAKHGIFGYSLRPNSFYNAVIDWMKKRHDWEIKKEWITVTPGVVSGLSMAILSYTHPGDEVIVQPPVYFPFFTVVKNNERRLVYNPLKLENGHYSMDFEDLKSKFTPRTKMLILCSPQNPTGRVWSRNELKKLGEICLEHNTLIISDEIHSDLVYKKSKHIPIASISDEFAQNTVTFIAPSKTFNVAGLSTSIAIIPNSKLFNSFSRIIEKLEVGLGNIFGTVATEAAYKYGEEWLEEVLIYLEGNLKFLKAFLEEKLPQVKVIEPEGTYLVWLDFRELGLNEHSLRDFLLKVAKVALINGATFGPGGEGFQRINIATPRSVLRKALERIEKAVKKLKTGGKA